MDEALRATLTDLAERVRRLEVAAASRERGAHPLRALVDLDGAAASAPPEQGQVVYAGAGPWGASSVAWQMERGWEEVVEQTGDRVARVLFALANETRVRIVGELVSGPAATGDLAARLGVATSGQLFHHLKELLAAGLVHQPQRGTYAVRPQHVLPLLAVLSASVDLALPAGDEPS